MTTALDIRSELILWQADAGIASDRLAARLDSIINAEDAPDGIDEVEDALQQYEDHVAIPRPRAEDERDEWDEERDSLWDEVIESVGNLIDELANADEPEAPEGPPPGPGRRRTYWRYRGADPLAPLATDFDVEMTPRAKRAERFERVDPEQPVYMVFDGSSLNLYAGEHAARAGVITAIRRRIRLARDQAAMLSTVTGTDQAAQARVIARAHHNAVPVRMAVEE